MHLARLGTVCSILLALAVAIAPARAAEPAGEALAELDLADGAALAEHWKASIYGRLWADPALASLHPLLDQSLAAVGQASGVDPLTTLAAAKSLSLLWLGLTNEPGAEPLPRVAVEADVGGSAAQLLDVLRKAGWKDEKLTGADEGVSSGASVLGRYNHQLRLGVNLRDPPAWTVKPSKADIAGRIDVPKIAAAVSALLPPEQADGAAGAALAWVRAHIGVVTTETRLVADGMLERMVIPQPTAGLVPVDRAVLARIPANALSGAAIGLDGAAWWKEYGALVLDAYGSAQQPALDARGAQAALDRALEGLGVPKLSELIGGINGTQLFFSTPGVPFPGYSLVVRRSPALDQAVGALLARLGEQAPDEGSSIILPMPNMPFAPQLALDHESWLLTTDGVLASQWAGAQGGWPASECGKVALAHADEHAVAISGSDTAAMVRMLGGYATMALGRLPISAEQKRAIQQGLGRLEAMAKPSYGVVRATATGVECEMQSLFGSTAVVAVIAAIAIPNLLESRVAANESAAAASLKSGFLPAEVQLQAGGYLDADGNGIGEYGFMPELAGAVPVAPNVTLNLLAPRLGDAKNVIAGYRYAVFLPDGNGGAVSELPIPRPKAGAAERERRWLAYAWPASPDQGRRIFAIDQSGTLYSAMATGQPPKWNDLYGGKTWADPPTWTPYRAGGWPPPRRREF